MKRREIQRVKQDFDDNAPPMLIIGERLLSREECDNIINEHMRLPFSEITMGHDGQENKVAAVNEEDMNHTWKYSTPDGKEFTVLQPGSVEFDRCIEFCYDFLPKAPEYGKVNYAQIIRYPEGTLFPFHKDNADSEDTATAIFFLNEEYEGGRLNVEGHTIQPRRGTMVTFNHSTKRWHGVEPIYRGERWVFAIWFGFQDEQLEEGTDDESISEVQSVSDDVRPDSSEVLG